MARVAHLLGVNLEGLRSRLGLRRLRPQKIVSVPSELVYRLKIASSGSRRMQGAETLTFL